MTITKSSVIPPFSHVLDTAYRLDETIAVQQLFQTFQLTEAQAETIERRAHALVSKVRQRKIKSLSLENFLKTYSLSSEEGLALMCLAEALLRIPDVATQTKLIRDKIGNAAWAKNISRSDSLMMNLVSMGLAASDQLLHFGLDKKSFLSSLGTLTRKLSEPVIRQGVRQAMKILGDQFVLGETIEAAFKRARDYQKAGYCFSYDMLGEAALTEKDAERYYIAYTKAIEALKDDMNHGSIFDRPSVSVKLSALHPRYEVAQRDRVLSELVPKVLTLAKLARDNHIGLTIDAEESERQILSLEIFGLVYADSSLKNWEGFGLAVQAYQKRAPAIIDWIVDIAKLHQRKIPMRLVKGAYWDSEIKRTQERGLADYPVYTHKAYTDMSYLFCAQKVFAADTWIYPQFASHNAYTISAIAELSGGKPYELQRLHCMGNQLFDQVMHEATVSCRIYAPVGIYRDLLSYLIRRLLENGATSSFVNQILDPEITVEALIQNPVVVAASYKGTPHPKIPKPQELLLPQRQNSRGLDLSDYAVIAELQAYIEKMPYPEPPPSQDQVAAQHCLMKAIAGFQQWTEKPVSERNQILHHLAELLENNLYELVGLLAREGGRTIPDGVSEVREAVDFCRYYGNLAEQLMNEPAILPGPTGEINQLSLHGRGVFVCISPWNFPLAIFLGQVVASLAAGNSVLAKPAGTTPRIAARVVELAYQAGVPRDVLQLMMIPGRQLDDWILSDARVAGAAFTGSNEVSREINAALAQKPGPIVPFIAETGGINAMIVDSSALFEQVVRDVISSAFQSAGQRCSALRLLFIQDDIADDLLRMLSGAMAELHIGDPTRLVTDIGPVIDKDAKTKLDTYAATLSDKAKLIYRCELAPGWTGQNFVAPQMWEILHADLLDNEVFGPILHVVRYKSKELDHVIDLINAKGYGLTMGLHSRIDEVIKRVRERARVGNLYVNRNMIGAVVGVQPFGGEGLSGSGPKAGGPHYLLRFMVERTFTQDTTAAGGNATLLTQGG